MQSVDLTVRLPDSMRLPVPEHTDRAVAREELLSWQIHEKEGIVGFLSLVVGDLEVCRSVVDDLDVAHRYDFTSIDSDTFYVYAEMEVRRADRAFLAAFNDLISETDSDDDRSRSVIEPNPPEGDTR